MAAPATTSTAMLENQHPVNGVRESMCALPAVLQLPLTLLTGKPSPGQRPPRMTAAAHLTGAVTSAAAGLAVGAAAVHGQGWWLLLLLPGWAVTLHGMRNLRMMIYHQCAHRNMWRTRRCERLLGRILSVLLILQDFDDYRAEHVAEHHSVHHMTLRDPTVQAFLISLELRPGMTRTKMWRRVLRKLFSPWFHLRFLTARARSCFRGPGQCIGAAFGYGAIAVLVTFADAWAFILLAWIVPLTILFQLSNTLRLCVKHTFPNSSVAALRGRDYFAGLTNAVFLGEPAPQRDGPARRRALAWSRWWLRMLCVHLPARYLVVTGDTVCHDYHHRHPMSREWADYIFARQADVDAGHPGWPSYREVWGLVPAINAVFDSLSAADPDAYDVTRLREVSNRELFTAFDD